LSRGDEALCMPQLCQARRDPTANTARHTGYPYQPLLKSHWATLRRDRRRRSKTHLTFPLPQER